MMHINTLTTSRRFWDVKEDAELKRLVQRYGAKDWKGIALKLNALFGCNRNGKRCHERWFKHVNPELRKGPWTADEDKLIVAGQALLGNKWVTIAKSIPGRSSGSIKCHWNRTLKGGLGSQNPTSITRDEDINLVP